MKKVIWKYLASSSVTEYQMPKGAKFLSLAIKGNENEVSMWFLVDPDAPKETRAIGLAGTGEPLIEEGLKAYLGTAVLKNGIVLHAFELLVAE
jgi:hypothetical protein